jgi:hypothetical protein
VPGRLRAFPGPNIVDATEEQEILAILDIAHPNREEALRELEALGNQMLARLGVVVFYTVRSVQSSLRTELDYISRSGPLRGPELAVFEAG